MLIDTESLDLLPMEQQILRVIAERLDATARMRCMGEPLVTDRPVTGTSAVRDQTDG